MHPEAGELPAAGDAPMCSALTADHRCRVYEARPTICRLWGVSEVMPCDHGQCFTALPLTGEETAAVLARSLQIGGDTPELRAHKAAVQAKLAATISRALLAQPPLTG